ncbi:MAG: TetR/AcrR family transcriptional regulator, partial [Cyanobacteria bacterium P01_A01_bin.80]
MMSSQTFFNLPQIKRQNIANAAIAEFANHSYESASISAIVNRAAIAKGSFYQYFKD